MRIQKLASRHIHLESDSLRGFPDITSIPYFHLQLRQEKQKPYQVLNSPLFRDFPRHGSGCGQGGTGSGELWGRMRGRLGSKPRQPKPRQPSQGSNFDMQRSVCAHVPEYAVFY